MRIPPLKMKILLEQNPPESRILVGRLAVKILYGRMAFSLETAHGNYLLHAADAVHQYACIMVCAVIEMYIYIYMYIHMYVYIYIYI